MWKDGYSMKRTMKKTWPYGRESMLNSSKGDVASYLALITYLPSANSDRPPFWGIYCSCPNPSMADAMHYDNWKFTSNSLLILYMGLCAHHQGTTISVIDITMTSCNWTSAYIYDYIIFVNKRWYQWYWTVVELITVELRELWLMEKDWLSLTILMLVYFTKLLHLLSLWQH